MWNYLTSGFKLAANPDKIPNPHEEPKSNPHLGFKRKPRVMIATEEEMKAAKIPLDKRDYCAHLLIKYKACRKDMWPFPVRCEHEKHEYLTCEHEDFIIRMKEYERERRLMEKGLAST